MEFTRLAQLTYHNKYYDAIARVSNELNRIQSSTKLPGLWPQRLDASGCFSERPGSVQDYILGVVDKPGADTAGHEPKVAPPVDAESYATFVDRADAQHLNARSESSSDDAISRRSTAVPECTEGLHGMVPGKEVFSLGSRSDSTYEYLPKQYLLLGGLDEQYRDMYEKAMRTAKKYLFYRPMINDQSRDLRFISDVALTQPLRTDYSHSRSLTYTYGGEHLSCYAGGMVALGAKAFGIDEDMDTAAKLTDACVWAYEATRTGIMPERFTLVPCESTASCPWDETRYKAALDPDPERRIRLAQQGKDLYAEENVADEEQRSDSPITESPDHSHASDAPHEEYVRRRIADERLPPGMVQIKAYGYVLRPEAIESVFIMYRLTGDNSWRQRGWEMFEFINRYTCTELANSAIDSVMSDKPQLTDEMESFWLAETLKYFYLLFSDPSLVSLDEYVL